MLRKVLAGLGLLGFATLGFGSQPKILPKVSAQEIAEVFKQLQTNYKYQVFGLVKQYDNKTHTAIIELGVDVTNSNTDILETQLVPLFKAFKGQTTFEVTGVQLDNFVQPKIKVENGVKVLVHGTLLSTKLVNQNCQPVQIYGYKLFACQF